MASASTPSQAGKAIKAKRKEIEPRPAGQRASSLLKHISDPTRLQILMMLGEGRTRGGLDRPVDPEPTLDEPSPRPVAARRDHHAETAG